MVSIVNLQTISNSTVHTVGAAMGIEKASLFLSDEIKGSFGLRASIGLDLDQSEGSMLLRDDPLVQRLTTRPEVLVREELEMARDGREEKEVASRMGQLEAEITFPLVSKEKLIGILNLGHKEGKKMYSHEDLEVLSTLANQAAIAVENARLYENLKNSQNIIRRADRLSSLGVLTAGLAHEIRNPLVAIRTFTQLLPERYQDKEFREEFQAIALREVDRICGLVNDLLSFARTSTPNVSAENINEIVESIVRILETEAKEKGVQIYRRLASSLPKIFIDKEQLKQVFMNVILNAIQSIEASGVVEISTRLAAKNGSQQFVQVGVRDSGVGIPEKDLENIFNPFFTTKKDGSGLGLSISHQIVQEHGGTIFVESKVGEGTTFFINLPVYHRGEGLPSSP
jgi:signal transduction histidine kinase